VYCELIYEPIVFTIHYIAVDMQKIVHGETAVNDVLCTGDSG